MTKRRDVYIVSTDREDLYELLKKRLGEDDNVEVVFDRRRGERRSQSRATKGARRRGDRRSYDERYYLLKHIGVIRVSAGRGEAAQGKR